MKLIINASLNYVGGGLQVALSFIQECALIPENTYYVFMSENVSSQIDVTSYPTNFVFYNIPNLTVIFHSQKNLFLQKETLILNLYLQE